MRSASLLSLAILLSIAACSAPITPAKHDAGGSSSNGDSGTPDAGASSPFTVISVNDAVTQGPASLPAIEVDNVVVVAIYSYLSTSGVTGTFYIQDQAPNSTTGISVYVAATDTATFPAVGDILNVSGSYSSFEGKLQISSYTANNLPLTLTAVGQGGLSSGGAYSPAGTPTEVQSSSTGDYGHTNTSAHPEQLGNVVKLDGPLSVTNSSPAGFVATSATGTHKSEGFEISGGVWVQDGNIYYNCLRGKGPDGGALVPDLSGGITGVWDHYQDYRSDGGATFSVVVPMTCADLGLTSTPADGGNTTTDGGNTTSDGGTTPDAGPAPTGNTVASAVASTTPRSVEVDGAVVVALYNYTSTTTSTLTGTFWIQDPKPHSSNGIVVYVAATDTVTFPSIGDVVTVKGYLSTYNGALQIASSTAPAVTLSVTGVGAGGLSSTGAYSPAGTATMLAASAVSGYAGSAANAHPEQVGTVLQFAGPLTVTSHSAPGLVLTKPDGGQVSEGFEITGGVYVDDSNVYYNCDRGLGPDGGTRYPTLTNGIRGVWTRYENGSTGTVYPVLVPMACSDIAL